MAESIEISPDQEKLLELKAMWDTKAIEANGPDSEKFIEACHKFAGEMEYIYGKNEVKRYKLYHILIGSSFGYGESNGPDLFDTPDHAFEKFIRERI